MQLRTLRTALFLSVICVCSVSAQNHAKSVGSHAVPEEPLEHGTPIKRTISGGQRHIYKVELSSGQFIKVEATQQNCDIMLALEAPDKTSIFEFKDDNFRNGTETQTAAVSAAGTYKLKVVSFEDGSVSGEYSLKISEVRPATDKELNNTAGLAMMTSLSKIAKDAATSEQIRTRIAQFETARDKFRFAGNRKWEAMAISSIGSNYVRLGNWTKAIELQSQAIEIQRSEGKDNDVVFLLTNMGNTYLHNDEPQKALEVLTEAAGLATLRNDLYNQTVVFGAIGRTYEEVGDVARALTYYSRELEAAEKLGQEKAIAFAANSMGKVHSILGDTTKASDYYKRSIELAQKSDNRRLEASVRGSLAQLLASIGDAAKAEAQLAEALIIIRSLSDKIGEAAILRTISAIRLSNGKPDEALELLKQSHEICSAVESQRGLAETYLLNGKAHARKGNFEAAESSAVAAINHIEKIRSGFKSTGLRDSFSSELQDFYAFYVEVLMERHKTATNNSFAALAFQASESARARGLINLLAESNVDVGQGVDRSLLHKQTEVKNLLSAQMENLTKALNGKSNPETVRDVKNEIESLNSTYESIQQQIKAASPRYAGLTQPKASSLQEIQSEVLDADSALLEYSLGKDKSYLWVVTKSDFQAIQLPAANVIEETARDFYEALTERNKRIRFETPVERDARIKSTDAGLNKLGEELGRMILAPAAGLLADKKLLIVADGTLQYVPFAALRISSAKGQPSRYLVETNDVVSLPSASVLAQLRKETLKRTPAPKTLAVLADPIFNEDDDRFLSLARRTNDRFNGRIEPVALNKKGTRSVDSPSGAFDLVRLPFTRREADLISSNVPEAQVEKRLDFSANRAAATSTRLSEYKYVHFATHGLINDQNPELSGLAFSMIDEAGKEQDGFLRVGEIYNLKLPAEMVVLSGCRTGLGKEIKGEGVVGMTRAFMYAGAKRVTFSLWDINDEATSELMGHFYREMFAAKKATPAAALRKAQIAMIKDKRWNNPYFWATFVLQGEPR